MTPRASDPKRLRELSDSLPSALSGALDDFAAQAPNTSAFDAVGSALSALGLPISLPAPVAPVAPHHVPTAKLAAVVREIIAASSSATSTTALSVGSIAAALGVGLASGAVVLALVSVAVPLSHDGSTPAQPSTSHRLELRGPAQPARSQLSLNAPERSAAGETPAPVPADARDAARPFDSSGEALPRGAKPSRSESPVPSHPSETGSALAGEQESELSLLARAQRALVTDPALALELLALHAQHFATSQLSQEREVIEVQALVRLGRRAEAEARAAAFRRRYPHSAHARRIDVVLGKQND